MKHITVVIEYENDEYIPSFSAHMTVLGGKIIAVAFEDALSEKVEKS
jgi:hypothetical protein